MKCEHETCDRAAYSRGWCLKHYKRWWRTGSIYKVRRFSDDFSLEARLNYKGWTLQETGCWEWNGRRDRLGYGQIEYQGGRLLTHRAAYLLWVGVLKPDEQVRHTCDNPPCMNPDHLIPGSQEENMQDMVDRQRFYSKITAQVAEEIRKRYASEQISQRVLGEAYGISQQQVSRIIHNEHWR